MPLCADFELARLVAIGAGEAALDVAEQLRLEQRFRQAGAVDRRERVRRARAARVDAAGDDFLADAALAGDQHLGVGPRHAVDFLLQRHHHRALADQLDAGFRPRRKTADVRSDFGEISHTLIFHSVIDWQIVQSAVDARA